jgi:peptidoglycan biosynthesis protein MviN/MurJ (putative lipid II flippase)
MGSSTVSLGKRIAKDSSLVTLISIGVQALTFLSSIYVAAIFGADWRTDAYFFALTIPWIFINVVSVVVKSVLVPV